MNHQLAAGVSYIVGFYNNVITLNSYYSAYETFMAKMANKYSSDQAEKKMEEEDKQQTERLVEMVREKANLVILGYEAMKDKVKYKETKKFEESIKTVKKDYIFKVDPLHDFVLEANKLLIDEVMSEILTKSWDAFEKIYGRGKTEQQQDPDTAAGA